MSPPFRRAGTGPCGPTRHVITGVHGRAAAGAARGLTWSPGYDGDEEWGGTVDFGPEERRAYHDRIEQSGLLTFDNTDDGLTGGPTGEATFGGSPGTSYDSGTLGTSEASQDMLDELEAATREIFPDEVWADMERRQKEWSARQPR